MLAMREGAYIVSRLLVEVLAVGDNDNAVEAWLSLLHLLYQLIGEPCDAVALT